MGGIIAGSYSVGQLGGAPMSIPRCARTAITAGVLLVAAAAGAPAASALAVPATWLQVSVSGLHTCAIATDHTLWCWGFNPKGELGIGSTVEQDSPVQVGTAANWIAVSAGSQHTCGIQTDHTLWCWGYAYDGELGTGQVHIQDLEVPTRVGIKANWREISAGAYSTCAVRIDHSLWCWGAGFAGQLGNGGTVNVYRPKPVGSLAVWAQVSFGGAQACAVRTDGTLWCWGNNSDGQLGLGSTGGIVLVPTQVGTATDWIQVAAGGLRTCGTRATGTLWCWGAAGDRISNPQPFVPTPTRVGIESDWGQVSAGGNDSCALHADPTLWCWGDDDYGQLGIGSTSGRLSPVRVGTGPIWRQVSVGGLATCAIRTDHTLWCWGNNDGGQLGIGGSVIQEDLPVQVG